MEAGVDGTSNVGISLVVRVGLRDGTSTSGKVGISVISSIVGPEATGEVDVMTGDLVESVGTLVVGSLNEG